MSTQRPIIYLSDLSKCVPQSVLSTKKKKKCWQLLSYEAESINGKMLNAGPGTEAPVVTLPLNLNGWYGIYVGILKGCPIKIKLKDDPCFTLIDTGPYFFYEISEAFWKYADLSNQNILFAQKASQSAFIAYIKLEPLSQTQVEAIKQDRKRTDTKRLIAMNDGYSFYCERPTTKEDIWEQIEPYRDTDFQKLYWGLGVGGDVCTYPTKIGTVIGGDTEDFPDIGCRHVAESMQTFQSKRIDTLKTALEYTHQIGLEFHVSERMGAFALSPPYEEFFTGRLFREHPEWQCVDKDGGKIARMSYAFPGVRKFVISLLCEVAEYEIDGVDLIFNRGAPFLLYEKPLIEGFMKEYGKNPRKIDEDDKTWLHYRAGYLTEFMRSLRKEMDRIGKKKNKRLQISAHVLNNESENIFYGLELATWIKEGLIDILIPYPWPDRNDTSPWGAVSSDVIDIEFFSRLTKGTDCKLYPEVMPRQMSPAEYRERVVRFYEAGADGLCFWDANGRHILPDQWNIIRRLGHKEELESWPWIVKSYCQVKEVKIKKIGGYNVEKYPPGWGY